MNVVILGSTSGIAEQMARQYAGRGAQLGLVARDAARLQTQKADLLVRGAPAVEVLAMDLAEAGGAEQVLKGLSQALGGIDVLVLAYGMLGDQDRSLDDLSYARLVLDTDFTSAALWTLAAAKAVPSTGTIAVISSVAGDRGRQSNFVYGSAKGGLALFGQGLAHTLAGRGPHVLVVKPGFVDTPMTAGMKKGGPLWATAPKAASLIIGAIERKAGPIVYVPGFWRWIMLIIRMVPAKIFHRTKL